MFTDLSSSPVSETIRNISADRATGDLTLSSGRAVKTIFFDHGRIVFAGSNVKSDRLGESLVAQGRLTEDDLHKAVTLMGGGSKRRRFGEALVEAGVLDRKELGGSVARQVKQIVLSYFETDNGQTIFEERKCPIPLEYMVSLSVHRLLYVGIRLMKNEELVAKAVGALDRRAVLAESPPFRFGTRKCSAEELEIIEQAKTPVSLRRLAWAPGGVVFSRLRSVYAMLASGVLEAVDKDAEAREPVIQMETSTFLLSALRNRPDPSFREAIEQEIEQELERSDKFDRESWLNLSKSAPKDELVRALEEKMERYHQLLEAVGDDPELTNDIEMILGRASAMLRLARQAPGAATPPAGVDVGPFQAVDEPIAQSTPAAATHPPASPAPSGTGEILSLGRSGPGASNFQGAAYAEHLLLEAQARMLVSDYANAVKVYEKLVEFAPEMPSYRAKLAIAMSRHPLTSKKAEREFLEAIRLDPDNSDFHYQFGKYYKVMKQRSRALAELRTAVRLDPQHKQARTELEAMSPKDSVLDNLRRLFK